MTGVWVVTEAEAGDAVETANASGATTKRAAASAARRWKERREVIEVFRSDVEPAA